MALQETIIQLKMNGYTELTKIAEFGIAGRKWKVMTWMKRFIIKYPDHELTKPFKALLDGNENPDGLSLQKNDL